MVANLKIAVESVIIRSELQAVKIIANPNADVVTETSLQVQRCKIQRALVLIEISPE